MFICRSPFDEGCVSADDRQREKGQTCAASLSCPLFCPKMYPACLILNTQTVWMWTAHILLHTRSYFCPWRSHQNRSALLPERHEGDCPLPPLLLLLLLPPCLHVFWCQRRTLFLSSTWKHWLLCSPTHQSKHMSSCSLALPWQDLWLSLSWAHVQQAEGGQRSASPIPQDRKYIRAKPPKRGTFLVALLQKMARD